jgi:hypothetical protein
LKKQIRAFFDFFSLLKAWPQAIEVSLCKMVTDFEISIKCPNCHIPLTLVQTQVTKVLEWISEEGKMEGNGQGSTEVFC